MSRYYEAWGCHTDVVNDYHEDTPPDDAIIYAGYDITGYEGEAIVVFLKDGELWENHDSHCSCNGLDRWEPEKAEIEALRKYTNWPGLNEALDEWVACVLAAQKDQPQDAEERIEELEQALGLLLDLVQTTFDPAWPLAKAAIQTARKVMEKK